jgi:hypothetical protein
MRRKAVWSSIIRNLLEKGIAPWYKHHKYFVVVQNTMPRIAELHYISSLLLVLCYATSSFSGVKGWCVEGGRVNILSQIEMLNCHSGSAANDDTAPCNTRPAHATGKQPCTTCFDIKPDILATKLLDDSSNSLVAPPTGNTIFLADEYSGLKAFAIASPGDTTATGGQTSCLQTQQVKAIRTVILLI